jgi:hypothetical protein
MEGAEIPGRLAPSAIDDQVLRVFGDIGIEVVEEATQCRFLEPTPGVQVPTVWSMEGEGDVEHPG